MIQWRARRLSRGARQVGGKRDEQENLLPNWQYRSQDALQVLQVWQAAHPRAILAEIERAVNEQMNRLRARMVEEVAQVYLAEQGRRCPHCEGRVQACGQHWRTLYAHGGQQATLRAVSGNGGLRIANHLQHARKQQLNLLQV